MDASSAGSACPARRSSKAGTGSRTASRWLKTREYIEILRAIWKREKPLEFQGEHYQIPYAGPDATGLGKPLKSILHPRADIPIVIAAIGPKNIELSAELARRVLPAFFNPYKSDVFTEPMQKGFAKRSSDLRPSSRVRSDRDVSGDRRPTT